MIFHFIVIMFEREPEKGFHDDEDQGYRFYECFLHREALKRVTMLEHLYSNRKTILRSSCVYVKIWANGTSLLLE